MRTSPKTLFAVMLTLTFLFPAAVAAAGVADSDWPCFKGNERRDGLSPNAFGDNPGLENWAAHLDMSIYTTPLVGPDGTIYVMSSTDFYAFDADGNQLWTHEWGGGDRKGPLLTDDGRIIYVRRDGNLAVMDTDGNDIWAFPLPDGTWSSPMVDGDGNIYIGTDEYKRWNTTTASYKWDASFYSLSPDGTLRWNKTFEYGILASPTLGNNGALYIPSGRNLTAMNLDGRVLWNVPLNGSAGGCTPAVGSDSTIYHVDYYGRIYHVRAGGALLGTYDLPPYVSGQVSLGPDGSVYVAGTDGVLYALTRTLSLKWTFETGYPYIEAPPTITNDSVILLGAMDGFLYAIDGDGSELWRFNVSSDVYGSPVLSGDGTVYVGTTGGDLISIGNGAPFQDPVDHVETDMTCCGVVYAPLAMAGFAAAVFIRKRQGWRS